jgi:hypothetical protein
MKKVDICDYPIFEVGTWNKMEFAEADIQEIADNYVALESQHQVPLKLGHNEEQPLTDGQPALGWLQNVRRVGKQLLADFVDVPKVVKELIAKKRFRAVSIELLMGLKRGDKTYKYVLDAVAILGADQPAVHTLPDLNLFLAKRSLAYDEGGRRVRFERQVDRKIVLNQQRPSGGHMDEEAREEMRRAVAAAVAAAVAPLNTQLDALRTENADWRGKFSAEETKRIAAETTAKQLKAEDEERAKVAKKSAVKMARDAVTALLEEGVKTKQITPAQRESAVAMFGIDEDERVLKLDVDKVRAFFAIRDKKVVQMSQQSTASGGGGGEEEGDPDRVHKDVFQEVDRRTRLEIAKNSKMTYRDATRVVFAQDPELHREYVHTDPPRFQAKAQAGGEA